MGLLVDGEWTKKDHLSGDEDGNFKRKDSVFRSWVTADGSAGPTGEGGFKAEPGRYHLYIARACPWAHRATIFRSLKGLESMIGLSVTHWYMGEEGWTFERAQGVVPDPVMDASHMHKLYTRADDDYTGSVTVPVLWDLKRDTIVSNESADIIRMFNSAFDDVGAREGDYYPEPLRAQIDEINERVYHTLNNGVYKSGFATSQEAHEEAVKPLFETMDWLESTLSQQRYLCGDRLTEADWRLFTTLLRFDPVYFGHFKCNLRRLVDYPSLWSYTRELYQHPGVRETVNMEHIKRHYYQSHKNVNPTGIVPVGPIIDFDAPPSRAI